MFGNGKIFISHTHQDNGLCDLFTAALDVWQADYWIDLQQLSAGQELLPHIHKPLSERDIFIRVCTPAANQSPWMEQEEMLARSLRAPNRSGKRLLINLVMAPGYQLTDTERGDVVIDATRQPTDAWIPQLRQALDIPAPGRRINRRAVIGLGVTSAAALAGVGIAGKLLLTPLAIPGFRPRVYAPETTPQAAASRLLWKYAAETNGVEASYGVGLSVDETGLYCATSFSLFSLGLVDGALRWEQFAELSPTSLFGNIPSQTAPALAGNTLYVLADDIQPLLLLALNAQDGALRWQATLDTNPSDTTLYYTAPAVVAGNSLVVQYNNSTAAFDITTHAPLWPAIRLNYPEGAFADVLLSSADSVVVAAPAVSGGVIYSGRPNGNLNAYSLATGELLWTFTDSSSSAPIQSTPAVVDGVVYFGRDNGFCYAVDARTGTLRWKQQLGDSTAGVSAPTVAGGVVYLCGGTASENGQAPQADAVYALDAGTGSVKWQVHPSNAILHGTLTAFTMMNQPLFWNGRLYVTGLLAPVSWTKRDVLYALDIANGNTLWYYLVAGLAQPTDVGDNQNFPSPPVAYGDTVYFVSSDATVYALSA